MMNNKKKIINSFVNAIKILMKLHIVHLAMINILVVRVKLKDIYMEVFIQDLYFLH